MKALKYLNKNNENTIYNMFKVNDNYNSYVSILHKHFCLYKKDEKVGNNDTIIQFNYVNDFHIKSVNAKNIKNTVTSSVDIKNINIFKKYLKKIICYPVKWKEYNINIISELLKVKNNFNCKEIIVFDKNTFKITDIVPEHKAERKKNKKKYIGFNFGYIRALYTQIGSIQKIGYKTIELRNRLAYLLYLKGEYAECFIVERDL